MVHWTKEACQGGRVRNFLATMHHRESDLLDRGCTSGPFFWLVKAEVHLLKGMTTTTHAHVVVRDRLLGLGVLLMSAKRQKLCKLNQRV